MSTRTVLEADQAQDLEGETLHAAGLGCDPTTAPVEETCTLHGSTLPGHYEPVMMGEDAMRLCFQGLETDQIRCALSMWQFVSRELELAETDSSVESILTTLRDKLLNPSIRLGRVVDFLQGLMIDREGEPTFSESDRFDIGYRELGMAIVAFTACQEDPLGADAFLSMLWSSKYDTEIAAGLSPERARSTLGYLGRRILERFPETKTGDVPLPLAGAQINEGICEAFSILERKAKEIDQRSTPSPAAVPAKDIHFAASSDLLRLVLGSLQDTEMPIRPKDQELPASTTPAETSFDRVLREFGERRKSQNQDTSLYETCFNQAMAAYNTHGLACVYTMAPAMLSRVNGASKGTPLSPADAQKKIAALQETLHEIDHHSSPSASVAMEAVGLGQLEDPLIVVDTGVNQIAFLADGQRIAIFPSSSLPKPAALWHIYCSATMGKIETDGIGSWGHARNTMPVFDDIQRLDLALAEQIGPRDQALWRSRGIPIERLVSAEQGKTSPLLREAVSAFQKKLLQEIRSKTAALQKEMASEKKLYKRGKEAVAEFLRQLESGVIEKGTQIHRRTKRQPPQICYSLHLSEYPSVTIDIVCTPAAGKLTTQGSSAGHYSVVIRNCPRQVRLPFGSKTQLGYSSLTLYGDDRSLSLRPEGFCSLLDIDPKTMSNIEGISFSAYDVVRAVFAGCEKAYRPSVLDRIANPFKGIFRTQRNY